MNLEYGRPADVEDRLPKEKRVYDFLDGLNISYGRVDHAPAMTMEDCAEIDRVLDAVTCKNLLLTNKQQTAFYLLLMPGDKPFKTKYLSAQIGSARLSFASSEKMEELLDITPGSLSVLGLINDREGKVTLLADEDVLKGEYIGFHPCINTSSLRFSMKDLLETIIPATNHTLQTVTLPWEVE